MKPTLKAPGSKRLKLEHEKLLSNFAFNFNWRRYTPVLPSATQRTPPASRSVTPMRTPVKPEDKEGGGDGTPSKRAARNSLGDEYAEDDEFDEGEAGMVFKLTFERR